MNMQPDETHDPGARSFVESANVEGCDFPIQNLPFGAFTNGQNASARLCVAIGDQVLDLAAASEHALLGDADESISGVCEEVCGEVCRESCLNPLMGLGPARWRALRRALFQLLGEHSPRRAEAALCLRRQQDVTLVLPVAIGNYTDFYASVHHASNVGALFRPDNPLLPNYKWVPIAYHGRASSIVLSGTAVRRPWGQWKPQWKAQGKPPSDDPPHFAPCRRLDYELEVGALVGVGNEMGEPIPIAQARDHIFGLCLVNDWSARDIQAWEYQPLGPFLSKSFATSLSPWVVTAEALAPFRVPAAVRPAGDPPALPYLADPDDQQRGGFDLTAEVDLQSAAMRAAGCPPHRISRGNLRDMYWTFAQMLTHHTSNGCDLRPGDLLASGTVSGPGPSARGCLLEITRGGAEPILLPNGEPRTFLEDGDEVRMRAYCQRPGAVRIGFGECTGTVMPPR
jgi:fumarylacetoacetase